MRSFRAIAASVIASAFTQSAVAQTPAQPKPKPHTLALISVTGGQGFGKGEMSTLEELLLTALSNTGRFKVIGPADIDAMLSLEARKEQVGCGDTDCAVRIAGALGVEYVATANIGRVGRKRVVTLKVIDVRLASVVGRRQQIVTSDDDLPDASSEVASAIVGDIWPAVLTQGTPPAAVPAPTPAALKPAVATGAPVPGTVTLPPAALAPAPKKADGVFPTALVFAGLAAAGVAAASTFGSIQKQCPSTVTTPEGVYGALECQQGYGLGADIAWGVAGASAVVSGSLFLTWALRQTPLRSEALALSIVPGGIVAERRF